MNMESPIIENNLDKECGALEGLFQQVMAEMKNGAPNFEEFIHKAGKLHTSLRSTILVFGSFLDSFQKIADSASNTKGTTRDIGTCLTRIVIRHRALESRMKTLAGALMDCLVLPIQGKLDEWKKVAAILDKEHAKGYKKNRSHIKKKYDQALRLRKKLKKDKASTPDPSVQRLYDQCSKDLNSYFRSLEKSEKAGVRRVLMEDRNRYCTFVAFLKPVLDEEIAMLSEMQQIEDIMMKLGRTASLEESTDVIIEDFVNAKVKNSRGLSEDNSSLYVPTPPSTPYMGSRNNSMSSLASDTTATNSSLSINFIGASPSRRSIQSEVDYTDFGTESSRPSSSLSQQEGQLVRFPEKITASRTGGDRPLSASSWSNDRPHTVSSSFNKRSPRPVLSGSTFKNDAERPHSPSLSSQYSTFSTIKRTTHSPFPRNQPLVSNPLAKRPPLPSQSTSSLNRASKSETAMRNLISKPPDSGPHYATPKSTFNMQLVPNFLSESQDMVIPHPVYMSNTMLDAVKISSPPIKSQDPGSPKFESSHLEDEGDLKTPIAEELSFSDRQTVVSKEDGSGSSSDSFGSSSGYGSQYTIRFDEHSKNEGHSPFHQNSKASLSNNNPLCRSSVDVSNTQTPLQEPNGRYLSASRQYSQARGTPLSNRKPPPPVRRSSVGGSNADISSSKKQGLLPSKDSEDNVSVDDDPTPRGSVENLSPILKISSSRTITTSSDVHARTLSPVTSFEKDGSVLRFYQMGDRKSSSLDESNYMKSPGIRANLEALNSFVQSSGSKKSPVSSTAPATTTSPRHLPNNIKAEIESALEKLRAKELQASNKMLETT